MSRAPSENVQLKIRMKEPLRAKLERAAHERGVSMNVEAVSRLEQSFAADEGVAEEFGGKEKYQIFRALSAASETVETRTGKSWLKDEETATTVNELWVKMVPLLMPNYRKQSDPIQFETTAQKRDNAGRCPDCGNERACYSCATQGGWQSEAEIEEQKRVPV
jgi:hypothetical protein